MNEEDKPYVPLIENAADYVDALLRPPLNARPPSWKFVEGRRMRDKFLNEVIVPADVDVRRD
ncbi:MAG TPA: hypothetical protein VFV71_05600 [Burkholderiales bacterium]|nr:hypothetical protein [Burkholderiales bacterium]